MCNLEVGQDMVEVWLSTVSCSDTCLQVLQAADSGVAIAGHVGSLGKGVYPVSHCVWAAVLAGHKGIQGCSGIGQLLRCMLQTHTEC